MAQFAKIIADGSAGFSNYTDKQKKYIGDTPIDCGCSITSEAMILKNIPGSDEYHLLPEIGYFEFVRRSSDKSELYGRSHKYPAANSVRGGAVL